MLLRIPLILFSLLFLNLMAQAQDDSDDELPEFLPGLVARLQSTSTVIQRVDEDVLFDWKAARLDPRMPAADRFTGRWSGFLQVKENGAFRISAFAAGKVSIHLAGQPVLTSQSQQEQWHQSEPLELRFGRHTLEIRYESPPNPAKLGLYWSGPSFALEPIAPRYLSHASELAPQEDPFQIGQNLSRGLRCSACHDFGVADEEPLQAPALTHLQDNLRPSWLVAHLTSKPGLESSDLSARRMPFYGLHPNTAAAISAALFAASKAPGKLEDLQVQLRALSRSRDKKAPEVRTTADAQLGAVAFASTGCIACHQIGDLGVPQNLDQQLYSGGALTQIAVKRTPSFYARWLADPSQVNADHRMPIFELSLNERLDVAAYLNQLGAEDSRQDTGAFGDQAIGGGALTQHRCAACHQLPASLHSKIVKSRISADSNWDGGCLTTPNPNSHIPGFALSKEQRVALRTYYQLRNTGSPLTASGPQLLAENNCLACHQRDDMPGVSLHLPKIATAHPELAARLAALSPPALTGIGDKLTNEALGKAILRTEAGLRPWLDVRMPKFKLDPASLKTLVEYFVGHDRLPEIELREIEMPSDQAGQLAASRLVTADGFGCQSCHQIGDVEAPMVDLKARGTNLAMLGDRIRPTWFQRWVRNPARIVPRMEMPAIQTPAKGVLNDSLDLQLEALWRTLNTPGFRPPRPNPVRIVRNFNLPGLQESSHVLTDVLEAPAHVYLRPLIVGLPNRHNVLFDLEKGELAAWWIGDTARQHTRGKTWYWEPGSEFLNRGTSFLERITVVDSSGKSWLPSLDGQVAVHLDSISRSAAGLQWTGRMNLANGEAQRQFHIRQWIRTLPVSENALHVTTSVELPAGEQVLLETSGDLSAQALGIEFQVAPDCYAVYASLNAELKLTGGRNLEIKPRGDATQVEWTSNYMTRLPRDGFPQVVVDQAKPVPILLDCVPGFDAVQLPLPTNEMPISLAWGPGGEMYAGSLKGQVLQLFDADGDGLHERYQVISDEFPTPYGLHADENGVDVLTKFALLRLAKPPATDGAVWDAKVLSDGWGYTADYHDWAVGLRRDALGNYYMALPCQQDDRSEAAAYLRGQALKLVPNHNSEDQHRSYRIEPIAAGLRFPMGIALSRSGELFTTDNQGNYNPFNELNHLRQDKRYGFINKLENKDGFSPSFESPAINLPHPWTRSVNGMCFLDTPESASKPKTFGAFEGHLIGCEMNGRALIRMSLQRVGDTYQGAAYLFSRPVAEGETSFEGPIVCEVSPSGDLYVGNLKDSGWGGGQNTGSVVRLRPNGELPLGIAEVRATSQAFEIDFTAAVDRDKATKLTSYSIRSYRRTSTPAYGGEDEDEKSEQVISVALSKNAHRATLDIGPLREGRVYEINLDAIGNTDAALFPSQAHYTMRSVPMARRPDGRRHESAPNEPTE